GSFTTGSGLTRINKTGWVKVVGGTLNVLGDLTIDGGKLTRDTAGTLNWATGKTLTVQNSGTVDIANSGWYSQSGGIINVKDTGSFFKVGGSVFNLGGGCQINLTAGGRLDVGALYLGANSGGGPGIQGNATMVVDGPGSAIVTSGGPNRIGDAGASGGLTLSNGATATFTGPFWVNAYGLNNQSGTVNVLSGATLSIDDLDIATYATNGAWGRMTVDGAGSAVIQSGAAYLKVGGLGELHIQNGSTFSTGSAGVSNTGWIDISGGTFAANGDINLNGGLLLRTSTGTFTWAAGKTMTLQNHGGAYFDGDYSLPTGATVNAGSNSPLGISGRLTVAGGSQVNLSTGANLSASGPLDVGTGGTNGTLVVDGAGSTASSYSSWGSDCVWGAAGGAAAVTYRNGASGSINYLTLVGDNTTGTSATVNVESGASLTVQDLKVNTAGGDTSATVTVTGASTNVGVPFGRTMTVGHASTGTATVNINDGAILSAGCFTIIHKTGSVNINGGTLRLSNPFFWVDGGTLNKSASGLFDFQPLGSWIIDVWNGGQVNLTGGWAAPPQPWPPSYAYFYVFDVEGAGSRFRTLADGSTASSPSINAGRATVSVTNGGEISAADRLWGTGSLTVDGAGSKAVSGTMQQSWSRDGSTAGQPGGIRFISTSVTNGGLLAAGSCIDVSGSLVVDGHGSSATAGPVYSRWANDGATAASVTFRNGSTGYFPGGIHLFADASSTGMSWAPDGSTGVTAASFKADLRVEGGAKLTTGDLVVNSIDADDANTMGFL
ncbi:MAG: hypothetical protein NTZ09_22075, partial [Candidatus Hydrogenedentes bacterium]|nr:hypothetical protein [Candidatus Hydrogenedentota bacterium]